MLGHLGSGIFLLFTDKLKKNVLKIETLVAPDRYGMKIMNPFIVSIKIVYFHNSQIGNSEALI